MQIDENEFIPPSVSNRKINQSRHSTKRILNRSQKIKDKSRTFPESTLTKIVFVSNSQGNAFRRQNLFLFDTPVNIDLQGMLDRINNACFRQWRSSTLALQSEPLHIYDSFQYFLGFLALVVFMVLIVCIIIGKSDQHLILAYIFMSLLFVSCFCSVIIMREKRVDINRDAGMIKAIKRELYDLNEQQKMKFQDHPRYLWTCHKDCLWIACEFY